MNQNPFNIYDFLGYLIPGAMFSFFLLISLYFSELNVSIEVLNQYIDIFEKIELAVYTVLIIVFYLIGHIISLLSALIIENFSIIKYGYPSTYLFGGDKEKKFNFELDSLLILIFTLPLHILEYLGSKFMSLNPNQLPEKVRNPYLIKVEKIFLDEEIIDKKGSLINDKGIKHDTFRFLYHYTLERTSNHYSTIKNYVALFGFTRAFSFIFLLIWWFNLILNINIDNLNKTLSFVCSIESFLMIFFSYVFFLGFNKFYRRYTLDSIMGAISRDEKKQDIDLNIK